MMLLSEILQNQFAEWSNNVHQFVIILPSSSGPYPLPLLAPTDAVQLPCPLVMHVPATPPGKFGLPDQAIAHPLGLAFPTSPFPTASPST